MSIRPARPALLTRPAVRPEVKAVKAVVLARPGRLARLECRVTGHPAPALAWLQDGRPLEGGLGLQVERTATSTSLTINTVSSDHWGLYTCRADNKMGSNEAAVRLKKGLSSF